MNTPDQHIAVIGACGAIGRAFISLLASRPDTISIHAFSRTSVNYDNPRIHSHIMRYEDEASIQTAASRLNGNKPLTLIIVATGILHTAEVKPEKSLKDLSCEKFQQVFHANAILPALIAKHFLPLLTRKGRSLFAVLSARVGSISDNRLGGWYAYRASKSALNMLIKTIAIEMRTKNANAIIAGLHPGTVMSPLSEPFQKHVGKNQWFTPEYAAQQLIAVIKQLTVSDSGNCFDYSGLKIAP